MVFSTTQFMASESLNEKNRENDFSQLVVILLLASGLSTRLGRAKMLLPWTSGTIFDTVVNRLLHETVQPLVVVCHPELPLTIHDNRVNYVLNNRPEHGISHSIQLAVSFLKANWPKAAAAILLGDEPFVLGGDIRNVMSDFDNRPSNCHFLRPRYNQIPGHPVMLDQKALSWAEQLSGDRGFGALWAQHTQEACYVDYSVRDRPSPTTDIDTLTDYRAAYSSAVTMEKNLKRG